MVLAVLGADSHDSIPVPGAAWPHLARNHGSSEAKRTACRCLRLGSEKSTTTRARLCSLYEVNHGLRMAVAWTFGVTIWQVSNAKNFDKITECHTFERFFLVHQFAAR